MSYTPHTEADIKKMLAFLGLESIDQLFRTIDPEIQKACKIDLPAPLSEFEVMNDIAAHAAENYDPSGKLCFLGGGAYDHFIPSAVNHLISRSEFYTCYTPYQAEVSQGTLQAIYEYQSMICRLTGMDIGNASGYDGASVTADAALMAVDIGKKRNRVLVSETLNPAYRGTVETYCYGSDREVATVRMSGGMIDREELKKLLDERTACLIVQQPNYFGVIENIAELAGMVHEAGALLVVNSDPVALAMLKTPGDLGADIAVGEGQALGVPLSFGGPYLGFFATRERFKRSLPGRLVGMTEDDQGRSGYVLTLQTREQHIKRERATSNICTNQALLALAATIYMSLTGKSGLKEVANLCLQKAHYLAEKISALDGYELLFAGQPYFREFAVRTPVDASIIVDRLADRGILAGIDLGRKYASLDNALLVAVTEKRSKAELDSLADALASLS